MPAGKSITGLTDPVIQSDAGVDQDGPSFLIALLLKSHDECVKSNIEDNYQGDQLTFEYKVQQGDDAHHYISAADNREEVVNTDDEAWWLLRLIIDDITHAHLEKLLAVEYVEDESDDLHGDDD